MQFGLRQALNYMRGGYAEVDPESRQRLEEQGYIVNDRPEVKAETDLKSSVNEPIMLVLGILTVIAAILMFVGNGDTLTWVGVVIYFVLLFVFTVLSSRAPKSERELQQGR